MRSALHKRSFERSFQIAAVYECTPSFLKCSKTVWVVMQAVKTFVCNNGQ